jgi:hypothetical protein
MPAAVDSARAYLSLVVAKVRGQLPVVASAIGQRPLRPQLAPGLWRLGRRLDRRLCPRPAGGSHLRGFRCFPTAAAHRRIPDSFFLPDALRRIADGAQIYRIHVVLAHVWRPNLIRPRVAHSVGRPAPQREDVVVLPRGLGSTTHMAEAVLCVGASSGGRGSGNRNPFRSGCLSHRKPARVLLHHAPRDTPRQCHGNRAGHARVGGSERPQLRVRRSSRRPSCPSAKGAL